MCLTFLDMIRCHYFLKPIYYWFLVVSIQKLYHFDLISILIHPSVGGILWQVLASYHLIGDYWMTNTFYFSSDVDVAARHTQDPVTCLYFRRSCKYAWYFFYEKVLHLHGNFYVNSANFTLLCGLTLMVIVWYSIFNEYRYHTFMGKFCLKMFDLKLVTFCINYCNEWLSRGVEISLSTWPLDNFLIEKLLATLMNRGMHLPLAPFGLTPRHNHSNNCSKIMKFKKFYDC